MNATVKLCSTDPVPGPIYDVHFHLGPDCPWRAEKDHSLDPSAGERLAEVAGLVRRVVFANPRPRADYAPVDRMLLATAGQGVLPFLRFDPKDVDHALERLDDPATLACRGVKLHPTVEFFGPDHPALAPVFRRMEEQNRVLLIHTDGREGSLAHAARLDVVARRHPRLTLILAHCNWACLPLLVRHPRIHVDSSCSRDGSLEVALHAFPDRVLFGSDTPYSTPETEINRVLACRPPASTIDRVFRDNFLRLLPEEGR